MSGNNNGIELKYDEDIIVLQKKVKEIIKSSSLFLHTSEMNIVEYLKNDQLIYELYNEKKKIINEKQDNLGSLNKIDKVIDWIDNIWFGLKLEERLSIVYYLY